MVIPVIVGTSPNVQNSKLQPYASTETPVFTNTQLSTDDRSKSATIAIHLLTTDERLMQLTIISVG